MRVGSLTLLVVSAALAVAIGAVSAAASSQPTVTFRPATIGLFRRTSVAVTGLSARSVEMRLITLHELERGSGSLRYWDGIGYIGSGNQACGVAGQRITLNDVRKEIARPQLTWIHHLPSCVLVPTIHVQATRPSDGRLG
jgi:hypothetical protein